MTPNRGRCGYPWRTVLAPEGRLPVDPVVPTEGCMGPEFEDVQSTNSSYIDAVWRVRTESAGAFSLSPRACYRGSIVKLGTGDQSHSSLRKEVPIEYDEEGYPGDGPSSTYRVVGKRSGGL